jgi:uncharacterized protein YggE
MKRGFLIVTGVGLAVAFVAVGAVVVVRHGPAPATAQSPSPTVPPSGAAARTIAVQGVGIVSGTPDTVTLNMGVQVQATSASAALSSASAKAQSLIDTLTDAGVAKADIQTGYVSVWPNYTGPGVVESGYWASNSLTAVIHDVAKAGPIIDAATKAVGDGTTLGGVSFSIADTSALYAQARKLAVDQARTHADQLATAAGGSVGAILSIDEAAQEMPLPVAYAPATTMAGAPSAVPPIEPGRQQLQLSVKVVFELHA